MLFSRLNIGLILLTVSVSFAQEFIAEPSDKTVYVGDDVTLNCVLNSGHGSHLWVKDTILVTQEYNTLTHVATADADSTRYTRYTVVDSSVTGYYGYSLHISNVQLQDAGVYQCIVLGGETGLESRKATLQVFSAPQKDFPTCSISTSSLHVSVGEEVTFSCESDGGSPATVLKWIRDVVLTEPSEATNTHTWTVTEDDNQAEFTCEGEHMLWSTPRSCSVGPFKLNTGEPSVKLAGRDMVEVESTATFVCSADQISTPQFSWYIDGVEVKPGHERITFNDAVDNNAIMRIPDISFGDAGTSVQCKINFFGGTLTSELFVIRVETGPTRAPPKEEDEVPPINEIDESDVEDEFIESTESGVSNSMIVGASMGIVALVLLVLILVGIVAIRRAARQMKKQQEENGENFTMRSRYVGVLRSWFFPVHEHTQKSMASFVTGPAMDNKGFQT